MGRMKRRHGKGPVQKGVLELEVAEVLEGIKEEKRPSPKTPLLMRPLAREPIMSTGRH